MGKSRADFRRMVRQFLVERLPQDIAVRGRRNFKPPMEDVRRWTAILHERGWSVPNWPVEYGGPGWTQTEQHVFEIECLRAGAPPPSPQGLYLVGPIVYTFASNALKARHLPPMRDGSVFWAQGFSEPNAGSDLGSLKTRAQRQGDHYCVNGQKIWTSDAAESEWLFLLVRAQSEDGEDRGISFLLVDLQTPGITIRPIPSIDGGTHLNEVFFSDVMVPAENLVGEEGKGWFYAKHLLTLERSSSAVVPQCVVGLERLQQLIASTPRLDGDPVLRVRVAELEIDLIAHEISTRRVMEGDDGEDFTLVSSTLKIRGSEMLQRIGALTMEVLGTAALPYYDRDDIAQALLDIRPFGDAVPGVAADLFYRRAATIYGGANEIQRNILAKALLRP